MHRSGGGCAAIAICRLSNVANVDLHSNLSLEHCRRGRGTSLVVESEGQRRKHTMLEISNLKRKQKEPIVTKIIPDTLILAAMLMPVAGHLLWTSFDVRDSCYISDI